MRIEKTETVELLDWEKENGLQIIVRYNYEEDNKYRRWVADLYNCKIRELTNTYLAIFTDCEIKECSSSLNSVLSLIADRIRGRHIYYNGHKIVCPNNIVHTKLVEPENTEEQFVYGLLGRGEYKEPPIDSEGWEQIDMSFQEESYYYKSKVYKYTTLRYDLKEESIFIHSGFILTITIFVNDFMAFKEKANLQENDSLQGQCFKIANYICSRLCDKIEK